MNEPAPLCRLCGHAESRLYLSRVYALAGQTYDLRRCRECGLVFVHPFPALETLRTLYSESYFHSDFACGVRAGSYLETERSRVEEYREILQEIQRRRPQGNLLEVGCAAGSFLNYARRAGFAVTGVDISEWAAHTGREQFGLDIRVGRLQEVRLDACAFDVVFLGDVLEHEPEPQAFLEEVVRVLKDDGLVLIKVPVYVNSFYYRLFRRLPWQWTLGRLDHRLLQALKVHPGQTRLPPYHLFEFSPETLTRLCRQVGLNLIARQNSLLIPEFLSRHPKGGSEKLVLLGFRLLKFLVSTFNIHGGHVMVLAVKSAPPPPGRVQG